MHQGVSGYMEISKHAAQTR